MNIDYVRGQRHTVGLNTYKQRLFLVVIEMWQLNPWPGFLLTDLGFDETKEQRHTKICDVSVSSCRVTLNENSRSEV
jgi:hypothetical protein